MNAVAAVPTAPVGVPEMALPAWGAALVTPVDSGPPNSILLYGDPGTRKTTISATIAQVHTPIASFKKVLFIDLENGTSVLSFDPTFAGIQIIKINPLDPTAKMKLDAIIADIVAHDYGFDAVVLDTFDLAQDIAEKSLKLALADSGNKWAAYDELGVWSENLAWSLHLAPHFVAILTAHADDKKQKDATIKVLPRLSGKAANTIGGIFDLVAYLSYMEHPETKMRHLVAIVGESDNMITKNRYRLQQSIPDFTMPVLYGLITDKIIASKAASAAFNTPAAVAA